MHLTGSHMYAFNITRVSQRITPMHLTESHLCIKQNHSVCIEHNHKGMH